jgi:hypothetical protein
VGLSCLLEKPGGSVIRRSIYFHRIRQTIIQWSRIVYSSTNRCNQKGWDTWLASKRHTHLGGGFVHFAQKYWLSVRVQKESTLLYSINKKPNSCFQFKNGETMSLTKTPLEKTSNKMKLRGRQLLLRLIFAGTVHRFQGMTLHRAVIDSCMKFWEHGQPHMDLSWVKSPCDLCICSLMIWTISRFTRPLASMLFKFLRRCNLPDPYRPPNFASW